MSLVLAAVLAGAAPADADPARRQAAADLAYVLGEIHALRRACAGRSEGAWRARMQALLRMEEGDALFQRRLKSRFNSGYLTAAAAHAGCGDQGVEAKRQAEREGVRLAQRLAGAPER